MAEKQIHEVNIQFPDYVRHNMDSWLGMLQQMVKYAGDSLVKASAVRAASVMSRDTGRTQDFPTFYAKVTDSVNLKSAE